MITTIDQFNSRYSSCKLRKADAKGPSGKELPLLISGSLDNTVSEDALTVIKRILPEVVNDGILVIDLEQAQYISSTGFGVLTELLIQTKSLGIFLKLRRLSPAHRLLLENLGLAGYFTIEPSDAGRPA